MKRYDRTARTIVVQGGHTFAIELAGNPSTGYIWQLSVDDRYLELVSQEFEPASMGVGTAGHEVALLRALRPGSTRIDCAYRRPWDSKARDTHWFQVVIG